MQMVNTFYTKKIRKLATWDIETTEYDCKHTTKKGDNSNKNSNKTYMAVFLMSAATGYFFR